MRTLIAVLSLFLLLPTVAAAKGSPHIKADVFYFDSHIRAVCDYRADAGAGWLNYSLSIQQSPSRTFHAPFPVRVAVGEFEIGQRIFDAYGTHDGRPTTYKMTCELTDAHGGRVAYSEHYYKFDPAAP